MVVGQALARIGARAHGGQIQEDEGREDGDDRDDDFHVLAVLSVSVANRLIGVYRLPVD